MTVSDSGQIMCDIVLTTKRHETAKAYFDDIAANLLR